MLRLAGDLLCGRLLFAWLSLVMSLLVSSCAVLDVICDLIESFLRDFLPTPFRGKYLRGFKGIK